MSMEYLFYEHLAVIAALIVALAAELLKWSSNITVILLIFCAVIYLHFFWLAAFKKKEDALRPYEKYRLAANLIWMVWIILHYIVNGDVRFW